MAKGSEMFLRVSQGPSGGPLAAWPRLFPQHFKDFSCENLLDLLGALFSILFPILFPILFLGRCTFRWYLYFFRKIFAVHWSKVSAQRIFSWKNKALRKKKRWPEPSEKSKGTEKAAQEHTRRGEKDAQILSQGALSKEQRTKYCHGRWSSNIKVGPLRSRDRITCTRRMK